MFPSSAPGLRRVSASANHAHLRVNTPLYGITPQRAACRLGRPTIFIGHLLEASIVLLSAITRRTNGHYPCSWGACSEGEKDIKRPTGNSKEACTNKYVRKNCDKCREGKMKGVKRDGKRRAESRSAPRRKWLLGGELPVNGTPRRAASERDSTGEGGPEAAIVQLTIMGASGWRWSRRVGRSHATRAPQALLKARIPLCCSGNHTGLLSRAGR